MTAEGSHPDGQMASAISNTVVRALARTTGRGPTKAKTTLGDNGVFVVLQDSLTVGACPRCKAPLATTKPLTVEVGRR